MLGYSLKNVVGKCRYVKGMRGTGASRAIDFSTWYFYLRAPA